MINKPKIKFINSLKMGKYRKQHKMFFAEGSINVLDFIRNTDLIVEIFAAKEWIEKYSEDIEDKLSHEVNEKEMAKITALKNPSEVLAIFRIPEYKLPSSSNIGSIILMLDDIKDPGNLGTIIRTADWFGIKNIICSRHSVDVFNPKVVQATMGSLARLNISYCDLSDWLGNAKEGLGIYGALLNGENINKIEKPKNGVLIIGSEAHGISSEILHFVNKPITIRRSENSQAESLNASIATAIILHSFND